MEHQTNTVIRKGQERENYEPQHNTHFVNWAHSVQLSNHKHFLEKNGKWYELNRAIVNHYNGLAPVDKHTLHLLELDRQLLSPELERITGALQANRALLNTFVQPGWYCFYCGYLESEQVTHDEKCDKCGAVLPVHTPPTRQYSGTEQKKKHCIGCSNNFYNGNNQYEIKECWSLASAKLILKKEVPVDQVPPWKQKAKKFLSCYHKPGFVYSGGERKG